MYNLQQPKLWSESGFCKLSTSVLNQRIDTRRKQLGLSQAQLGARIGVSQAAIQRVLSGQTLNPRHIIKLARALHWTVEELTGELAELPDDFTAEERSWIEMLRGLEPHNRAAVITLTRSLANSAATPLLQSSNTEFRGK